MTARVDRADCFLEDVALSMSRAIVDEARRTGSVGAHVIEFAEEPPDWGTEASEPLCRGWGDLEVRDTWVVHRDRYWSPGCTDPGCCPPGGRPLPGRQGAVTGDRRGHGLDAKDRRRARRARARFLARRRDGEAAWRATALAEWSEAMEGTVPSAPRLGRLGAGLAAPAVRDAVILAAFGAEEPQQRALLEDRTDAATEERLDRVMHGDLEPVGGAGRPPACRARRRRLADGGRGARGGTGGDGVDRLVVGRPGEMHASRGSGARGRRALAARRACGRDRRARYPSWLAQGTAVTSRGRVDFAGSRTRIWNMLLAVGVIL